MRKTVSLVLIGLLVISLVAAAGCGKADDAKKTQAPKYPTKPIELIVPYAAGGGTDAVGRALAEALKGALKQDVVVLNKTGGAGAVGMNEGLHAKPDGYTITMVTREVAILPLLGQAPFKTMDFRYISNINVDPELVVVSTNSPYKTVEDLIKAMKAAPGKLKYAAASVPNFYAIQFSLAADVQFITVPFQGAAPAMTEVLGGRADFGIYNPGEVKAQIEAGKLRPLAIMAEKTLRRPQRHADLQGKRLQRRLRHLPRHRRAAEYPGRRRESPRRSPGEGRQRPQIRRVHEQIHAGYRLHGPGRIQSHG